MRLHCRLAFVAHILRFCCCPTDFVAFEGLSTWAIVDGRAYYADPWAHVAFVWGGINTAWMTGLLLMQLYVTHVLGERTGTFLKRRGLFARGRPAVSTTAASAPTPTSVWQNTLRFWRGTA